MFPRILLYFSYYDESLSKATLKGNIIIQDYFEISLMKIDEALHKFVYNREKMVHDIFYLVQIAIQLPLKILNNTYSSFLHFFIVIALISIDYCRIKNLSLRQRKGCCFGNQLGLRLFWLIKMQFVNNFIITACQRCF